MADGGLFAIEVDADDYATVAADDPPTTSRTFQSDADFEAQVAAYSAKIDQGNSVADFIRILPDTTNRKDSSTPNLSKREAQLLGYAVGEFYHDRKYLDVIMLCQRVVDTYSVEEKIRANLDKWILRCRQRVEREG